MRVGITANWNGETDVTKVTFSKDYEAVYNIAKLDFLRDVIYELEQEYDRRIEEGSQSDLLNRKQKG